MLDIFISPKTNASNMIKINYFDCYKAANCLHQVQTSRHILFQVWMFIQYDIGKVANVLC